MDQNEVLVRPSPAGLAAAGGGGGTIPCAGCAGTAGDFLEPPDLSNPCFRCSGGLPLCRRCAAIGAGIGGSGADAGGGAKETSLEKAIMCTACASFVCSEPACSTRCSDVECETQFCSSCRGGVLSECSGCLMLHCASAGDPETDCLLPCEGKPGCRAEVCRLCQSGRHGCEICSAAVCDSCRKECATCKTVSCPECLTLAEVKGFCEGCNADCCLICLMCMRPCDKCGQAVSLEQLRKSMASMTGDIEKWATFGLAGDEEEQPLPPRSRAAREDVARRWAAFIAAGATTTSSGGGAASAAENGVEQQKSTSSRKVFRFGGVDEGVGAVAGGGGGSPPQPAVPAPAPAPAPNAARGALATGLTKMKRFFGTGSGGASAKAAQEQQAPAAAPAAPAATAPAAAAASMAQPKSSEPRADAAAAAAVAVASPKEAADAAFAALSAGVAAGTAGFGGGGGGGGSRTRLSLEAARNFVEINAAHPETTRRTTTLEDVKLVFSGWVDPGVVELYYDASEDIVQTIRQCEAAMEQVVLNEHAFVAAAAASSPPAASPLPSSATGDGGGGGGGASSSQPSTGQSDWTMYTSVENAWRAYWHNAKTGETTWEDPHQQTLEAISRARDAASAVIRQMEADCRQLLADGQLGTDKILGWLKQLRDLGLEFASNETIRGQLETTVDGFNDLLMAFISCLVRPDDGAASARTEAVEVETMLVETQSAFNSIRANPLPESSLTALRAAARLKAAEQRRDGKSKIETEKKAEAARRGAAAAAPSTPSEPNVEPKRATSIGGAPAAAGGGGGAAGGQQAKAKDGLKKTAGANTATAGGSGSKAGAGGGGGGRAAAAAAAVNLEDEMAKVQESEEERKQAARAKKTTRRMEEALEEEEKEAREAKAREEAAARRSAAREAAAAQSKAAAARGEADRIAKAKAAMEARVMAAVAAQAKNEKEAKEAAKRKIKEDDEANQQERQQRVERAKAVADANAANAAGKAEKERHEKEAAAASAAGARAGAGVSATGGGGGALAADMSLEDRLKKAIERGNAIAIQSIYDEADQTPGASMKKIKKKCQRWLNKKAGEEQKLQQASKPAPAPRAAGAGGAAATALASQRPAQFEMFCPSNIAPQIIGKGGATINRLMRESKAKIVVRQTPNKSASDVVITGTTAAVKHATRLVEEFYRSKGCEPTTLPPPSTAAPPPSTAASGRVRAAGAAGLQGVPPAQPAMSGGGSGGGGGGGAPAVVEDGVWGGELRQLLKVAGCEHHLERFRKDQLDGEVLLMMEREDFARMGVSEAEEIRILNGLKVSGGGGGGGAADDEEDSDGLDPDHPDTCKICMDALVDILFLPCAHQCTCSRCGGAFAGKPCILCRTVVKKVQKVIRVRSS
eukprot:g10015.t1